MNLRLLIRRVLVRVGETIRAALPESVRRDFDQFRLLSRDAVRQLIDSALLSRDSDPMEYALWMLALIATPPAFFAARQVLTYTGLKNAPVEVVMQVALTHRLFFIIYGMLAAALLAALTWETVFPDGRDQEVVGTLPVRPHTFAAARLWAAVTVSFVFSAIVNLPAAVLYTAFCAGHPAFGNIVALLLGHVLATMLGSLVVFFTLLTIRGLAAVALGVRAGAWLGAGLQLLSVVLMFEVFFFLPKVLGTLIKAMKSSDPAALLFPPVWFASLHAWIAGEADGLLTAAALRGAVAFTLSVLVVAPMYLVPARWLGRRALERRSSERAAGLTMLVEAVARVTGASPAVRGVFQFAVASLIRSRRHLLVLATYFGVATAISVASFWLMEERGSKLGNPSEWLLAFPLVFIFFSVLGLRSSFRIPTDLEANWPFRLTQPSLSTCVNASVLVMVTLAVLPITSVTMALTLPMWALGDVLLSALLQLLAGWMLIELVLTRWSKVPFACAHAPSPDVLKAWWPAYGLAIYLYAFRLSDWQFAALTSTRAFGSYVGCLLMIIAIVRRMRRRRFRHQSLEFDAPPGYTTERLNLSEAVN